MIRIYCQYSYGGFQTFSIKGTKEEPVNKVVTIDNRQCFPESANVFFSFGGAKIAYRKLNNSEYTLVCRDIPSLHRDTDGRKIPCAVQFICADEDKSVLDNMAIAIANELNEFETFFADLFYESNGLNIDGDRLRAYISSFSNCSFEGQSPLLSIKSSDSPVILFVSSSDKFWKDDFATKQTMGQLQLSREDLKNAIIMSYSELLQNQNQLKKVKPKDMEQTYDENLLHGSDIDNQKNEENTDVENKDNKLTENNNSMENQNSSQNLTKEKETEKNVIQELRSDIEKINRDKRMLEKNFTQLLESFNNEKAENKSELAKINKKLKYSVYGIYVLALAILITIIFK